MLASFREALGRAVARYLNSEMKGYQSLSTANEEQLSATLLPCDVLLVEGNTRISSAIKFVTHSTWSHAAFYAGSGTLIEAHLQHGVCTVPLSKYASSNTRICRPVGLLAEDSAAVIAYMRSSIGKRYDLKNVVDLARYLLPAPPVPARFRRRLLALGSGDPTRAICSTLIAEAFQAVRYPILPVIQSDCPTECAQEILHIRHHSLFAPRDFDISPYFRVVKPTIERGFEYRALIWNDVDATIAAS